jgi:uracil-DNA glycosylase
VSEDFQSLLAQVRACSVCAPHLPLGPRPILRGRPSAGVLIVSQAPGARVHESGLSFDDPSGDRLREWLGLDRETFYDESRIAIIPIGLCYPGRHAKGSDLPPRRECAPLWHARLRAAFPAVELTLLVGQCAIAYYLKQSRRLRMTETIARWRDFLPEFFVLPHPSWHAIAWTRNNPWFEREALPELRSRLSRLLDPARLARSADQPAASIRSMSSSLNPK